MWYKFKFDKNKFSAKTRSIIDFYLFNCPIRTSNVQSKTIENYGWNNSKLKSGLTRKLRNVIGIKCFIVSKSENEFIMELQNHNELINITTVKEFVLLQKDGSTISEQLFRTIRNAFAHGSFEIIKNKRITYYAFENTFRNKLKARILVKETTLIKWIEILKNANF